MKYYSLLLFGTFFLINNTFCIKADLNVDQDQFAENVIEPIADSGVLIAPEWILTTQKFNGIKTIVIQNQSYSVIKSQIHNNVCLLKIDRPAYSYISSEASHNYGEKPFVFQFSNLNDQFNHSKPFLTGSLQFIKQDNDRAYFTQHKWNSVRSQRDDIEKVQTPVKPIVNKNTVNNNGPSKVQSILKSLNNNPTKNNVQTPVRPVVNNNTVNNNGPSKVQSILKSLNNNPTNNNFPQKAQTPVKSAVNNNPIKNNVPSNNVPPQVVVTPVISGVKDQFNNEFRTEAESLLRSLKGKRLTFMVYTSDTEIDNHYTDVYKVMEMMFYLVNKADGNQVNVVLQAKIPDNSYKNIQQRNALIAPLEKMVPAEVKDALRKAQGINRFTIKKIDHKVTITTKKCGSFNDKLKDLKILKDFSEHTKGLNFSNLNVYCLYEKGDFYLWQ